MNEVRVQAGDFDLGAEVARQIAASHAAVRPIRRSQASSPCAEISRSRSRRAKTSSSRSSAASTAWGS